MYGNEEGCFCDLATIGDCFGIVFALLVRQERLRSPSIRFEPKATAARLQVF